MMNDEYIRELAASIDREKIERARRQSPEEKFFDGPRLFDWACRLMADGIRMQFPHADDTEVNRRVRERLEIMKRLEEHPFVLR